jgi:hypothetical protein
MLMTWLEITLHDRIVECICNCMLSLITEILSHSKYDLSSSHLKNTTCIEFLVISMLLTPTAVLAVHVKCILRYFVVDNKPTSVFIILLSFG